MATLAFQRVSVWLDAVAPDPATFAHAFDWARHLGLPLRAVAARCRPPARPVGREMVRECAEVDCDIGPLARACAATCDQAMVPLDAVTWQGQLETGVQVLMGPADLCVVGGGLPDRLRAALLRQCLDSPRTSALLSPAAWHRVARILVLHQTSRSSTEYLIAAAAVCRRFDVRPLVLTVARTDREARRRRQSAEEIMATCGMTADFDVVVGADGLDAAAWVARWRRCSHVVIAKQRAQGWWRWPHAKSVEKVLDLSDRLTFLALPGVDSGVDSGLQSDAVRSSRASFGPGAKE